MIERKGDPLQRISYAMEYNVNPEQRAKHFKWISQMEEFKRGKLSTRRIQKNGKKERGDVEKMDGRKIQFKLFFLAMG